MRKAYWYLTAYLKKHGTIVIISFITGVAFFWFLLPPFVEYLAVSERHYIGIIGDYSLSDLPPQVSEKLSIGLTRITEDGTPKAAAAERWTIDQEGTTVRFVLKKDLLWQDGTPLTPSDISYKLPQVETIVTPNDIVFKLPAPFAPFTTTVTKPLFKEGTIDGFLKRKPTVIGLGEFSIKKYESVGQRLKELIIEGNGKQFIYRFYLTEDAALTAFKLGEIDQLSGLAREFDVFNWSTVSMKKTLNTSQYLAVFFNVRNPLFTKNIRQALSYALEKPVSNERAIGPISRDSWGYLEGGKTYDQDWIRGSERILAEIPQQPLAIELTTTNLFVDDAEKIKKTWEAFGLQVYEDCKKNAAIKDKATCENTKISVTIRVNNFPDTTNFQALLTGQKTSADPDQYTLWHSSQPTNFTGYKNTRIDSLLEKGRQTYDLQERTEIYQEFQQFFLEDPPAIFIRYLWNFDIART